MKKLLFILVTLSITSSLYCPPERTKKGKFLQQDASTRLKAVLNSGDTKQIKAYITGANDKNSLVWPIVNYALNTNNVAILQPLKRFNLNLNQPNKEGKTPLLEALQQQKPFVVQALLLLGANPDTANEQGITPLMLAAVEWDEQSTRQLLLYGANPFLKSSEGKTVFEYASESETGTFFENPASVILRDLNYALERLNEKEQNVYRDFLNAIQIGNTKRLNTIIDNNQDFFRDEEKFKKTIRNSNGQNPLSIAITIPDITESVRLDLVEILLTRTITDVNTPNSDGTTPLHQAILLHNPDIIAFFIDNDEIEKIAINAQDNKGSTPLHNAVQTNDFYAIERLLALGANTTIEDQNGKTPSFYATTTTAFNLLQGEPVTEEQKEQDARLVAKQNADEKAVKILEDRGGKCTKK